MGEHENAWIVKVWGVRGGYPVMRPDFLEYGGNTSCISVERKGELIIFDGGTGLNVLEDKLARPMKIKTFHILISHLHIDHVMGLFGLKAFYDKEAKIRLYGPGSEGESFSRQLDKLVGKPYWPLGFKEFKADVRIQDLKAGESFFIGDGEKGLHIGTFPGKHPGDSLLYRLEGDGKRLVYGLDCEADEDIIPDLARFAKGAALMIWDANFAPGDERKGWGHSTWEQGIKFRKTAGIGKMLMTHYSGEYEDGFLEVQEGLLRKRDSRSRFAREGMEISL